jgi:hypothetical protein
VPALEPRAIAYYRLKATHPEYDLEYWQELRALYEGGKALLRNPKVLDRLFPRHGGETEKVYQERKRRAFYVSHLSTVIDHVVAGLSADPIELALGDAAPSSFYRDLFADCSPPRGRERSVHELVLEQLRSALLCGFTWTLVDLPTMPPDWSPQSEAEQEAAGALNAYAAPLRPEAVLDWDADADGEVYWTMVCSKSCRRPTPYEKRDKVREEYTAYDAEGWTRWVVEYEKGKPPNEDAMISPESRGRHSFGRTPIIRLELPAGLWAGNKLHSLAVEYLNKSCGLSWAEYKALYSQLYEFLAPALGGIDTPVSEHQSNPGRAQTSARGPGWVQVRGHEDSAMYVGPDTGAFAHAGDSLKRLAEDIFRVMYQMALAEDNSGAVIRRSEGSKQLDHEATEVILRALGREGRRHAAATVNTIAIGRRDPDGWVASGMDDFHGVDLGAEIDRAMGLETVPIPSATYQRARKLRLALADLGDEATDEIREAIRRELEEAITQDSLAGPMVELGTPSEPPDETPEDS